MRMKNRSLATVLVASLVGLLAGAGQVFYISFFPACVLGTVLAALFFAWGGWLPAALYLAASVGGVGWLFGAGVARSMAAVSTIASSFFILVSSISFDPCRFSGLVYHSASAGDIRLTGDPGISLLL